MKSPTDYTDLGSLDVFVDIYERDGQVVTDSLSVAKAFGKSHRNLLRKIDNLQCSQEVRLLNFEQSSYNNAQSKRQPLVEMTKDGMMFLIMGFSGKKADMVREAYVAELS